MTNPTSVIRRTYVRPHLYTKQEQALFADARYVYCEASTKSGKLPPDPRMHRLAT